MLPAAFLVLTFQVSQKRETLTLATRPF